MNANATATSYNGHDTECICTDCMMADMAAHIRATRGDDADRLLTELGTINTKVVGERTRFKTPGQRSGRGVVRAISPKQAKYVAFLLKSRDFTSLMSKPWFTTNVANISLAGCRTLIDALLGCPVRADFTPEIRMATPKQVEWLAKLDDKNVPAEIEAIRVKGDKATFAEASKALDVLFKAPRKVTVTTRTPITPGMYWHGEDIVKVKFNRDGNGMYASVWRLFDEPQPTARGLKYGTFDYVSGLVRKLDPERRMTLAEAQAMGAQFHFCIRCGIELTNENSIDAGIGPVCASKF